MARLITKLLAVIALCVAIFLTVQDRPKGVMGCANDSQSASAELEPLVTSEPDKLKEEIVVGSEIIEATEATRDMLHPVVPEYVTAVASGGYWEEGDQSGIIRVIVVQQGWEHVTSRVYLEWIKEEGRRQELEIILQIPIDEINEAGVWSIESPIMVSSASSLRIDLPATRTDLSRKRNFEVIIPANGIGNFEVE